MAKKCKCKYPTEDDVTISELILDSPRFSEKEKQRLLHRFNELIDMAQNLEDLRTSSRIDDVKRAIEQLSVEVDIVSDYVQRLEDDIESA